MTYTLLQDRLTTTMLAVVQAAIIKGVPEVPNVDDAAVWLDDWLTAPRTGPDPIDDWRAGVGLKEA